MIKYIITGGSSFIGVALTKLLMNNGHFVYVACRKSSKTIYNIPHNERIKVIFYDDLKDISSIKYKIDYAEVFIHLAWGGTGHEGRNDISIQNDNIKYSLEAIDTAKELGCKLFVEAGSQAEYGYVNELIREETPCHPENEYGKAKYKFGELASKKCQELGMKFIHLRIFSIYGETDHEWTLVTSSIKKMLNNEEIELSSCSQMWNFLYVKDAVKQIFLLCNYAIAIQNYKSEIYNIASKDTRTLKSFVEEMYQLTKSKSKLLFGKYTPDNVVSLNPDITKTEKATNGFISDYTFKEVIKLIINNYRKNYD